MDRRRCILTNVILLIWFFLDMTGLNIKGHILVTRSYKEDGIFFMIFLVIFILFILKDRLWKYLLTTWLLIWFIAQILSHWYFTIFGPSIGKINYFADTIKLINSSDTYIPDLYHIILHILICISLINMIKYCAISKKVNLME